MSEQLIHLGSRSGSIFTLALFSAVFLMLAIAVGLRLWKQGLRTLALVLALMIYSGPVSLIYATSLNGFYAMRLDQQGLQLESLLPGDVTEVAWSQVMRVSARPVFKLRWRLFIQLDSGDVVQSATWNETAVREASAVVESRWQEAVGAQPPH